MINHSNTQITDTTRLADLTVGEFKQLLHSILDAAFNELVQELPDPDLGKTLHPEFAATLTAALDKPVGGIDLAAMKQQLGLTDE